MSEPIEGCCACGEYHWDAESFDPPRWSDRYRSVDHHYCPGCGYLLADDCAGLIDGFAYSMVRADLVAALESKVLGLVDLTDSQDNALSGHIAVVDALMAKAAELEKELAVRDRALILTAELLGEWHGHEHWTTEVPSKALIQAREESETKEEAK